MVDCDNSIITQVTPDDVNNIQISSGKCLFVYLHRRRKTTRAPGHIRAPQRSYPELPGVRVIVHMYRGGSNYGPQAVGTALDFIDRAGRRANPRIYDAYVHLFINFINFSYFHLFQVWIIIYKYSCNFNLYYLR